MSTTTTRNDLDEEDRIILEAFVKNPRYKRIVAHIKRTNERLDFATSLEHGAMRQAQDAGFNAAFRVMEKFAEKSDVRQDLQKPWESRGSKDTPNKK